jgi:hypothetical protein
MLHAVLTRMETYWCMLIDKYTSVLPWQSLQACHIVLASILGKASVSWAYCYGNEFSKVLRICNRYSAKVHDDMYRQKQCPSCFMLERIPIHAC